MAYWMVMGRRLEERITILFKEARLRGHHHPGIGQEAAASASVMVWRKKIMYRYPIAARTRN